MLTPAIIKISKYLKDSGEGRSKEQLATIINEEQEYVNKALERLAAADVVREEQGSYLYNPTPRSEDFLNRLVKVYERVDRKSEREWIIRGIICEIPSRHSFHLKALLNILEEEGLDREESKEFIEQEIERHYLRRIRIALIGRRAYSFPIPRYIPYRWLSFFRWVREKEYEALKQGYESSEIQEEDYLVGQYPSQLARAAREHLKGEKKEIRDKLLDDGLLSYFGNLW
jgi:hypothetical protein